MYIIFSVYSTDVHYIFSIQYRCTSYFQYTVQVHIIFSVYSTGVHYFSVYSTVQLYIIFSVKHTVFFDFSLTVKAAPQECVIRTGQP